MAELSWKNEGCYMRVFASLSKFIFSKNQHGKKQTVLLVHMCTWDYIWCWNTYANFLPFKKSW